MKLYFGLDFRKKEILSLSPHKHNLVFSRLIRTLATLRKKHDAEVRVVASYLAGK